MKSLDEASLNTYFTRQFGVKASIVAQKQSFPGISRESWFVDLMLGDHVERFVLRVDPPEGPATPMPLATEFNVYQRLFGSQVPVAEPLWYAEREEVLDGRPHMIRRLVEGRPTVDGLFDDSREGSARRRRVAYECIEKLAMVHLLDWRNIGMDEVLVPPHSAADALAAEYRIWRDRWFTERVAPSPLFEESLLWLGENIPCDTPHISLVKGNNGLGEEIWQGERIVAMSDWEMSCLGDGISDLFWSQGTVRLIGFDDVLSHYQACTGQSVSIERLAFASQFALVKMYVAMRTTWYRPYWLGKTRKPFALAIAPFLIDVEYKLGHCVGKSPEECFAIINKTEKAMYVGLGKKDL